MSGQQYERELRDVLRKEGWVVFRSAGSHGADLIALKPYRELSWHPGISCCDHMIIEVKATKYDSYKTTLDKPQFDLLNAYAKQGFNVFYYIRWKGEKQWSRFKLPQEGYPVFKKKDKVECETCGYYDFGNTAPTAYGAFCSRSKTNIGNVNKDGRCKHHTEVMI